MSGGGVMADALRMVNVEGWLPCGGRKKRRDGWLGAKKERKDENKRKRAEIYTRKKRE
jgi:hypothetical protein